MLRYIFIGSFIIACVFQGIRWSKFTIYDADIWTNQAMYVENSSPQEFDAALAYGHPGGPVVEGTIVFHKVLGISYRDALIVFLTIFNSLLIAGSSVVCYMLRKDYLWSIATVGVFSLHTLFTFATPPSAVVSLVVLLSSLLTLYIFEKREDVALSSLVLWAMVCGIAIATRIDIGAATFITFLAILTFVLSWRKIFMLSIGSFLCFVLFDPFMWFMPIQHIKDLIAKIIYHYAEFVPAHMSISSVISISLLAFLSMAFSVVFLFFRKKLLQPLPPIFTWILLLMTVLLYTVLLTARYQAARYFQPIVFIWEGFLPLFILSFIGNIHFSFLKTEMGQRRAQFILKLFMITALVSNQIFLAFFVLPDYF